MVTDAFTRLARHYDDLMASVPYPMWVDYLERLLDCHGRRGQRVLDLATGTGSVALILARHGYQVTGVDISAPMLEQAAAKSAREGLPIDWVHQDLTQLDLPAGAWDWACCLYDSLNYVIGEGGLARACQGTSRALRQGGLFIFDLNTPYCFERELFTQHHTVPTAKVRYRWRSHYDPARRLARVDMVFWTEEGEFRETHYQRAYQDQELEQALAGSGCHLLARYEAYTLLPSGPASDRIFYVAEKLADPVEQTAVCTTRKQTFVRAKARLRPAGMPPRPLLCPTALNQLGQRLPVHADR